MATVSTQTDFEEVNVDNVTEETHEVINEYYSSENNQGDTQSSKTIKKIVGELLTIADEVDKKMKIRKLVRDNMTPNMSLREYFHCIADQIFAKGKSWGKIAALLVLGSELARVHGETDEPQLIIVEVIKWVISYIVEKVSSWIAESGGWIAICEFVESTKSSSSNGTLVVGCGMTCAAAAILGIYYFSRTT